VEPTPAAYQYIGQELDLFTEARRWKAYVRSALAPYIRGNVLEVGAGLGTTTRALRDATPDRWTCLEPDATLATRLTESLQAEPLPTPVEVRIGTVAELDPSERFDSILYIDVLEHIANDVQELERAQACLHPGGRLIVLCPAHNYLFSPFDQAIGHHRRYDRRMIRALNPPGVQLETCFYLDSLGILLSLGNRLLLRSATPTHAQIAFWDTWIVPTSRVVDRLTLRNLGKTVIAAWRKPLGT
jgi:SAM-dependent methyltransferase